MDLWNKIFPSRLKSEQLRSSSSPATATTASPPSASNDASRAAFSQSSPFGLEKSDVRVLLYRDCDRRGRKLLYDSQTVVRIPLPKEAPSPPQCSPSRFFRPRVGLTSPTSSSRSEKMSLGNVSSPSVAAAAGSHGNKDRNQARYKVSAGESYVEIRNGYGYQYLKEANDTKQIGELVFGSVALAFKGPSAKLHLMKEPSRILLSRTFKAPRSYRSTFASSDTGIDESFSSLSASLSEFHLTKLDSSMEGSFTRSLQTGFRPAVAQELGPGGEQWCGLRACHSEEDSGFSGPPSPFSSICGSYLNPRSLPCTPMGTPSSRSGSGSSLSKSSGSLSSLQRRFLRNVATSLESFGFASVEDDRREEGRSTAMYQTKLGLAVILETKQESSEIEREGESWWFNQQEILESFTNKLQMSLEEAYLHRSKFVSSSFEAVSQLCQELEDLVSAPRLTEPLWLSLLSSSSDLGFKKDHLYGRLIDSLTFLLSKFDTKQTNFFFSKLLTAVLTHHLGWVSTVGPQITTSRSSSYEGEGTCSSILHENSTMKSLPYNAIWGQLRELTGSIGFPSKLTRTVLVGDSDHKDLLNHALVVLSYLIRCSQVLENHFDDCESGDKLSSSSKSISDLSSSSSTSVMTLLESNLTTTASGDSRRSSFKSNRSLRQDGRTKIIRNDSLKRTNSPPLSVRSTEENKPIPRDDYFQKFPHSSKYSKLSSDQETSSLSNIQKPTLTASKTMGNLSLYCDVSSDPLDDSDSNKRETNLHSEFPSESKLKHTSSLNTSKYYGEMSDMMECINKPEIKVSGEEIKLEVEEGGKVLFILGEDDRLEGLKPKADNLSKYSNNVSPANNKSDSSADDQHSRSEEPFHKTDPSVSHVESKTSPTASIEVEHVRQQGNDPSHKYHKKFSLNINEPLIPTILKEGHYHRSTHKRNMSDPTNGAYLSELRYHQAQNSRTLNVVNEKDDVTRYPEDKRVKKKRKRKPNEECCDDESFPESSLEEWDRLDKHSKVVDLQNINLVPERQSRLSVAESLMGGVLDHYSSVFVLHASTDVDSKIEEKIRLDLSAAAQRPVLDSRISEAIAIIAEADKWEVELLSSHSYPVEKRGCDSGGSAPVSNGGIPVMISPLVSQMSDSLFNLIRIQAPPYFIAQCIEQHLRGVYLKSQLLSTYLIEGTRATLRQTEQCPSSPTGGKSLYNLTELTHTLGIDLNDLPLLLSVASTHTPALSQMFGLSFK